MKYYIYISDTKVDMLFAQIPTNILKKISAELKINLGVISVSLKEKVVDQTRYDKLSVVTKYINEHEAVGTVDNPQGYFKGTLPMRWIKLPEESEEDNNPDVIPLEEKNDSKKGFVYFAGNTEHTIFGLGGSLRHLIGGRQESGWGVGSFSYYILRGLKKSIKIKIGPNSPQISDDQKIDGHGPLTYIYNASAYLTGPKERLEFLAKRLIEESLDFEGVAQHHTLLGSPIYVAYAD